MGNITNLATTGNYKNEVNGLKVEFFFVIDNEKNILKEFHGTVESVTEDIEERPNLSLATFNKNEYSHEVPNGVIMTLTKGREAELVTVIVDAVEALEYKIKSGKAFEL